MNRRAVVLAADSATTVTSWNENGREERYFKGANKVFQLSDIYPVGIMIFDSSEILRMPWELVVKEYRAKNGSKSFNRLVEYADDFFQFVASSKDLISDEARRVHLVNAAHFSVLQIIFRAQSPENEGDQSGAKSAVDTAIAERLVEVEGQPFVSGLDQGFLDQQLQSVVPELATLIADGFGDSRYVGPSDPQAAAHLGVLQVIKSPETYFGTTGLVFAGFGALDFFPSAAQYVSSGLIANIHIYRMELKQDITHENPAWLRAFAQTSMSDTFASGLSEDIYLSVMQALQDNLHALAAEVTAASGGDLSGIPDLNQLLQKCSERVSDAMFDKAESGHALPMRRVLSSLPVDEMANLAETLINLQSLKEKVTKPSETVGGPVDVAVITKHEGLVWIKRKLFFDAGLNPRFLQRQSARFADKMGGSGA